MKSAYAVLGVPGNASAADIQAAFEKAIAVYSPARMAEDVAVAERLVEIREAEKLLSNPQLRAAHDRKLNAAVNTPAARPRLVIEAAPAPWYTKPLPVMALVVVAMFAVGSYMSHSREKTRLALATQELAQKKLEEETAAREQAENRRVSAEREQRESADLRREQIQRNQANYATRSSDYANRQDTYAVQRQLDRDRSQAQQLENQAKNDERQRVYDAQNRLRQDQARIRELCMQQYRTPNC